ncbi:LysE family translocator [Vibrio paucivorans]|uniref:LysE family translocator n=1 Tax=Vibrio paucivorans TaxID=2829489 RepID=A0A9X3CEC1_9VIBR|nr:LysE family translocator [Vibrio paucivorans]MCW8334147.1 LysE family translocator [Vibrio paucivorans]
MEYLYAVVLFAVSSSVTPGPNNIMVMTSGVNFGVRRTLPLLAGICVGFTVMLLVVGFGFGQLFQVFPALHFIIKCLGTGYLLYLAWLIAKAGSISNSKQQAKPLTFMKGALFQWVNGKAWVVATGAIAAFTTSGAGFYTQNLIIAVTFFIASFPAVGLWLFFGTLLKRWLTKDNHRRWFNYSMSALLIVSVLPVIKEIFIQSPTFLSI